MKIQSSTMKIHAVITALCFAMAASRALRGDLVQTMDSVTDLVQRQVHANATASDVENEITAVKAAAVTLRNKTRTEMKETSVGKAATRTLRIKGMACDAEMCKAQQRAQCEAKCDLERSAKRRQGNGTAVLNTATGTGSLRADASVWHTWSGLYETHIGYIKDCFGYSAGKDSELQSSQAQITSSRGSTKAFEVKHGQERMGICYAIYYIGTVEEKTTKSCRSYEHLRQSLCPECCQSTASMNGCSGGCPP